MGTFFSKICNSNDSMLDLFYQVKCKVVISTAFILNNRFLYQLSISTILAFFARRSYLQQVACQRPPKDFYAIHVDQAGFQQLCDRK